MQEWFNWRSWKDRIPQGIASSNLAPSANLYTTSFLFRPASGGARQSRLAGPKILILKNGGVYLKISEPKLRTIGSAGGRAKTTPPFRFGDRWAKPAKIETFFRGRAQEFFSIKESIFAGFASLLTQERAASHPTARLRRAKQASKNSFSPHPFFFLPACFSERIFSDGGGASTWTAGGLWIFTLAFSL